MIGDANEVNERVEALNLFSHKIRGNMSCDDIEQLFTNIPHEDLLQKINKLIDRVWDHHMVSQSPIGHPCMRAAIACRPCRRSPLGQPGLRSHPIRSTLSLVADARVPRCLVAWARA